MSPTASYRGQPLVALMVVLGGWVAVRALLLEAERFEPSTSVRPAAARAEDRALPAPQFGLAGEVRSRRETVLPQFAPLSTPISPPFAPTRHFVPAEPLRPAMRFAPMPLPPSAAPVPSPVPVQVAAGHQLLWMAALSQMPLPPGLMARTSDVAPVPIAASKYDGVPRWSADGWLLLRRGGAVSTAGGLAPPVYGASQLGAVARYKLAPQSAHRPALYLRGSAALNGSREREAAFGLSIRPIAGLPVAVAAEGRINSQPGGTHVRPAAFAYTEMQPVNLPLGTRAEFYGQAGYVGGDFATAFADGQVRVDRRVAGIGRGELRAGGGVWGGAQRGASRLDLGPTATLGVPFGGSSGARVALDWRFRITGNATPASGPALTLSAGF